MNVSRLSLASALMACGLLSAAPAFASDTANIGVSATVTSVCKFTSGGSISFTLDPTSTTAAAPTSQSDPKFWCTKGTSYTVTDNVSAHASGTTRRMQHADDQSEYIAYSLSYTATGTGQGRSTEIPLTLSASVSNAAFVNAKAGSYTDTVQLSFLP